MFVILFISYILTGPAYGPLLGEEAKIFLRRPRDSGLYYDFLE